MIRKEIVFLLFMGGLLILGSCTSGLSVAASHSASQSRDALSRNHHRFVLAGMAVLSETGVCGTQRPIHRYPPV